MAKQIIYDDQSRQAILRGVNQLADAAKAEVASALAAIGDEDLGCPVESWHDHSLCGNVAATS